MIGGCGLWGLRDRGGLSLLRALNWSANLRATAASIQPFVQRIFPTIQNIDILIYLSTEYIDISIWII